MAEGTAVRVLGSWLVGGEDGLTSARAGESAMCGLRTEDTRLRAEEFKLRSLDESEGSKQEREA